MSIKRLLHHADPLPLLLINAVSVTTFVTILQKASDNNQ